MTGSATDSPVLAARLAAGMSREELAYRAGLALRTLERIELNGVTPRRATVVVLALALKVEPESLIPEPAKDAA